MKDRIINVAVEDSDITETIDSVAAVIRNRIINVPMIGNYHDSSMHRVDSLPRNIAEAGIVPVKLKRKKEFKSCVLSSYIDPVRMIKALEYIKESGHPSYVDVKINYESFWSENTNEDEDTVGIVDENDQELAEIEQPTLFYDNYPEIRMQTQDKVHCSDGLVIAPGEGKVPSNLMRDTDWDINAFPTLFPNGKFGLNFKRKVKLTPQKYFVQRMLNSNNKFSSCPPWLFAALYYIERYQLEQQININYRRGKFVNKKVLQIEDGFDVFDKISGTPRFWQQKRYEMVARLEQLEPFQFFLP